MVDYHNPDEAVAEIKKITLGGVSAGLECTGGTTSTKLSMEAFGSKGGLLTTLLGLPEGLDKIRSDVKVERILLYTVGGYVSATPITDLRVKSHTDTSQSFEFLPGTILPASPEDKAWFIEFVKASPELITKYGIKGNPVEVRQGLDSVLPGLAELKVSIRIYITCLADMIRRARCLGRSLYIRSCRDAIASVRCFRFLEVSETREFWREIYTKILLLGSLLCTLSLMADSTRLGNAAEYDVDLHSIYAAYL